MKVNYPHYPKIRKNKESNLHFCEFRKTDGRSLAGARPNITQPLKNGDFCSFLAITPVWDLVETWGFRVDDP